MKPTTEKLLCVRENFSCAVGADDDDFLVEKVLAKCFYSFDLFGQLIAQKIEHPIVSKLYNWCI